MGNGRARKPYCCMILLSIGGADGISDTRRRWFAPTTMPIVERGQTLAPRLLTARIQPTARLVGGMTVSISTARSLSMVVTSTFRGRRDLEVKFAGTAPVLDGAAGGKDSLAARSTILLLPLHSMRLVRRSLNFAHVPVVYAGHLSIVPCDRDCIPPGFGDNAAIGGIASPKHTGALLEVLGFRDGHCCSTGCLAHT
jgi:hypothetical protein